MEAMVRIYALPLLLIILVFNVSTGFDRYGDYRTFKADNMINDQESYWEDKRSGIPEKLDILMPNVSPQKKDSYFCTAIKVPESDAYIVEYEPHAKMQTAHHMLMFGCDVPGKSGSKGYWNCGEMGGTCRGSVDKIMYAWAKDAPPLKLPKDVGFHVGGKSQVKYIVLQVHYANVEQFKRHHKTDQSGVTLHLTSKRPKYFAGIYLVAAGGPAIPPKKPVFDMDMSCYYTSGPEMHPFAFRVHTHKLGTVVTGYRVRDGKWTLIGKGDPQRPQAFYDVVSKKSLQPGDVLAARCTYNSLKREATTYIGATGADEMCNFYMMYYYDPAEGYSSDSCTPAQISANDYPSDADVPLEPANDENMKRDVEDDQEHLRLTVQANWPEDDLSQGKFAVGQISGVATKMSGDVVIFHRADRKWEANTFDSENRLHPSYVKTPIKEDTVLFLTKETGKVDRKWGDNIFHFPHGLSVDHEDNMWFTDVGMHQVFKFSAEGQLLLTLGKKFVPGSDRLHFCKPTDVAVETNGNFYVSDGYCNNRILKFSSNGNLLHTIDNRLLSGITNFPPPANFLVPHSVSLDRHHDVLYVADRENGRVLAFSTRTGQFLHQYTRFGDRVFAVSYSPIKGGMLFTVNGQSPSQPSIQGFTFEIEQKKIIQEWSPKRGFVYPHDITCDPAGRFVYVSEITSPGKLWKFKDTIAKTEN